MLNRIWYTRCSIESGIYGVQKNLDFFLRWRFIILGAALPVESVAQGVALWVEVLVVEDLPDRVYMGLARGAGALWWSFPAWILY